MKVIIEHYQDLARLYASWAMKFRDEANDSESAKWAQKLSASYAQTARLNLINLITKENENND